MYTLLVHAPVLTSKEAADIRKVDLTTGAKALLIHASAQEKFFLAVMSASRKFNWQDFRKVTKEKRLRFATEEELIKITGCLSGAVPPFGSLFPVPTETFVDESLADI